MSTHIRVTDGDYTHEGDLAWTPRADVIPEARVQVWQTLKGDYWLLTEERKPRETRDVYNNQGSQFVRLATVQSRNEDVVHVILDAISTQQA